jgi:hypothetical protein
LAFARFRYKLLMLHLTQLDAKAAQAGVTRSVWLRALFDKIF